MDGRGGLDEKCGFFFFLSTFSCLLLLVLVVVLGLILLRLVIDDGMTPEKRERESGRVIGGGE